MIFFTDTLKRDVATDPGSSVGFGTFRARLSEKIGICIIKAARETMSTQAPTTRTGLTNLFNSIYVTTPTKRTKTVSKMMLILMVLQQAYPLRSRISSRSAPAGRVSSVKILRDFRFSMGAGEDIRFLDSLVVSPFLVAMTLA